jgi:hypothetical protein
MSVLPNTTTRRVYRRWPLYALLAVSLVALVLIVEAFLRAEAFSPGEEISGSGIRDVVVSEENSLYPPLDTGYFQKSPRTIYVYMSVEDLPSGEDMEARVERAWSGSVFSFFEREAGIEALDEQEDQLSAGENGSTGILKLAFRTSSGEPVPPGNYTLEVHGSGEAGGEGAVAVRKSFVVEE